MLNVVNVLEVELLDQLTLVKVLTLEERNTAVDILVVLEL